MKRGWFRIGFMVREIEGKDIGDIEQLIYEENGVEGNVKFFIFIFNESGFDVEEVVGEGKVLCIVCILESF